MTKGKNLPCSSYPSPLLHYSICGSLQEAYRDEGVLWGHSGLKTDLNFHLQPVSLPELGHLALKRRAAPWEPWF